MAGKILMQKKIFKNDICKILKFNLFENLLLLFNYILQFKFLLKFFMGIIINYCIY